MRQILEKFYMAQLGRLWLILFMAFYIKGMIQKEMDDVKNNSIQSVLPI